MSAAKPPDGAIVISECKNCHKAIVWSQYTDRWVHQRDYNERCSEERKP